MTPAERPAVPADAFWALLEGTDEAAFLAGVDGAITFFSPGAEVLTGRRAADVVGRVCSEALGCLSPERCPAERLGSGSFWSEGSCRGRRTDGAAVAFRLRVRNLFDPAGRAVGRIALFREAQARETVEKKLLAHQRLASIGELAASLIHEVGNPVSIILGFAGLLVQQAGDDPGGEIRDRIFEEAKRCRRIVDQLLSYSRSSSREPRPVPLSLKEILVDVTGLLGYRATRKGISFTLDWSPDVPMVSGDPGELKQVFLNLLLNALEAMEDGGEIRVRGRAVRKERTVGGDSLLRPRVGVLVETWAEVTVEDEGSGLGTGDPERLFAPFQTTKENGGGLGLAVCRRLLRERGGDVRLQNGPEGGARAVVELPGVA